MPYGYNPADFSHNYMAEGIARTGALMGNAIASIPEIKRQEEDRARKLEREDFEFEEKKKSAIDLDEARELLKQNKISNEELRDQLYIEMERIDESVFRAANKDKATVLKIIKSRPTNVENLKYLTDMEKLVLPVVVKNNEWTKRARTGYDVSTVARGDRLVNETRYTNPSGASWTEQTISPGEKPRNAAELQIEMAARGYAPADYKSLPEYTSFENQMQDIGKRRVAELVDSAKQTGMTREALQSTISRDPLADDAPTDFVKALTAEVPGALTEADKLRLEKLRTGGGGKSPSVTNGLELLRQAASLEKGATKMTFNSDRRRELQALADQLRQRANRILGIKSPDRPAAQKPAQDSGYYRD